MAQTFIEGEEFGAVRAKLNGNANELDQLAATVGGISSAGDITWTSGNALIRVEARVAGRTRVLLLRSGGDASIDPTSPQGPAHWTVEEELVALSSALGPYLSVGHLAFYNGRLYELLTSYNSLPTGISSSQWQIIGSGSTSNTAAPAAPTNLRAGSITSTTLEMLWDASATAGVTGYEIRRQGALVAGTGLTTVYEHADLNPSTSYALAVRAIGSDGQRSADATITLRTANDGSTAEPASISPPPSKVRAATYSASPGVIDVYINGTLTSSQQYEIRIDGTIVATTASGYRRFEGYANGGAGFPVDVRKVDGSAFSERVAIEANAIPGSQNDGEATAGTPA